MSLLLMSCSAKYLQRHLLPIAPHTLVTVKETYVVQIIISYNFVHNINYLIIMNILKRSNKIQLTLHHSLIGTAAA